MRTFFESQEPMQIVIEVGTHSRWVDRLLRELGHEVLVANARQVRLIYRSNKKNDRNDAQMLARLGRLDPKLLFPLKHRTDEEWEDLDWVKTRATLVEERTRLINQIRGKVKSHGGRIPSCSAESFPKQAKAIVDQEGLKALVPLLTIISTVTAEIKKCDRQIQELSRTKYPETKVIQTAPGVGPVTALTYRLVLQTPDRFPNSRDVGSYLGLTPIQDQSGDSDKQKRITKAGDRYLRTLLVQSAQYILGRFGPESPLKRWGLRLAERGGKNAKKRAVVAVARKLAVVLMAMWKSGQDYDVLRTGRKTVARAA